jgi:starch-binding outer membrane protein, SusD/RagB family
MRRDRAVTIPLLVGLLAGAAGCNLSGLAGANQLPSGTTDPGTYATPAGALAMYNNAVYTFEYAQVATQSVGGTTGATQGSNGAVVDYMLQSGEFTDELHAGNLGGPVADYTSLTVWDSVDARNLVATSSAVTVYMDLQTVRGSASLAIGALKAYYPAAPTDLRGKLYAQTGFAIVMLADFYCSGVPLSTLNFNGDYTYTAGFTTQQLYQAAIAQFDTAITLSPDSIRVLDMARVGLGRAYLDLGDFPDAAAAVAQVPDNFAYQFGVDWTGEQTNGQGIFSQAGGGSGTSVSDGEGEVGLPFISSGDPRSAVQASATSPNMFGQTEYAPLKYGGASMGILPMTVADGTEARLIEAEAAYQTGDYTTWLNKLNEARSNVAPSLPALTDPGTDPARIQLMFSERAYDLFLTGHRQGDLRRMVRQYDLPQYSVYPTGRYPSGIPVYGNDVNVPVPSNESSNPMWAGCLNRGA